MNSALTSNPTRKKKIAIQQSFTQYTIGLLILNSPMRISPTIIRMES